jgi:hypothetical protein
MLPNPIDGEFASQGEEPVNDDAVMAEEDFPDLMEGIMGMDSDQIQRAEASHGSLGSGEGSDDQSEGRFNKSSAFD